MSLPDSRMPPVLTLARVTQGARPVAGDAGAQELLRQLQRHQLELVQQNEALRDTQINLDAERARYVALFDLAPVAYLTVNESGLIQQANLAAASLLGVDRNAMHQQALSAFMTVEGGDLFHLLRQRFFASGAPGSCEVPMRRLGSAPFTAQLSCVPTPGAGACTELFIIVTDMTAHRQTQELRIKEEAAQAASQAKSRFLVAASHDLRQPTHAMGMFIARLAQLPQDPPTRHLVDRLEASVRTLQDMLENLFDVSRFGTGSVQVQERPFPINEVFDQLREGFAGAAFDKGLRLRIRPSPAWLQGDPMLLHRILFNLVSNAVRYTEHGSILVACRPASGASEARVEVWDSGIGISEPHHEKIFDEFYQVGNSERDSTKGLGLGLSIVAHTCKLLQLPLSMRSQPGCGTRFTLQIPATQALPEWAQAAQAADVPIDKLRGRHMLVIDEDPAGRDALASLLLSWGCTVAAADGPARACELLRGAPPPDVIISDYRLRDGVNGIEAVRQLREAANQPLAACLISGDTDSHLKQQAQEAGLLLLHKPVRPAKLRSLLGHLCQSLTP